MKILAIRIKNLASLEGTTEIDFTLEPLASAGIFAITGPTGAGKSTLLDAICLALYSRTPRYLQAKEMGIEIHDVQGSTMSQGDVRGILRDGMADGFAEVDFKGTDGQNYRANWSVRRARNKAEGSLQADAISLKNLTENTDLPGKKAETLKEIERLVGLNFEQFTRSVLLAQGDFTAFMKATKDEKSSLLEKLTGTQIYSDISKKIFENFKYQEQLLRDLYIRKEGIATLSEEEVIEIQLQEQDVTQKIAILSQDLDTFSKEIIWHEQVTILQENVNRAIEHAEKTKENLILSESRRVNLIQIEQVQVTRSWHDALLFSENQLVEQNTTLADLQKKISDLESARASLEQQSEQENLNFLLAKKMQTEALPKLAEAKKLDTLLVEKEKQKETATTEKDSSESQLALHQKEMATLSEEVNHAEIEIETINDWQSKYESKKSIAINKDVIISKLTDAEKIVNALKISNAEQIKLETNIALNAAKITEAETVFEKLNSEFESQKKIIEDQSKVLMLMPVEQWQMDQEETNQRLTNTLEAQSIWEVLYQLEMDFSALRQKQAADEADFDQKTQQLQQLKAKVQQHFTAKETSGNGLQRARLSASENVERLRAALQENEPCIVCGSTEHPYKSHNPQLEKVLSTLEEIHHKNEKTYLEAFAESNRLGQEVGQLKTIVEKQTAEMAAKAQQLLAKKQLWNLHPISIQSERIADLEKSTWIEAELKSLKAKQLDLLTKIKTYEEQKKQLESAKTQFEKLKENRDFKKDVLKDLANHLAIFKQELNSVQKVISQANLALADIKINLDGHFSTADWMEKWIEKPTDFLASVQQFAQEWQHKSEQLEVLKNENNIRTSTVKQLKNQEKSLIETLTQKTIIAEKIKAELASLISKRNDIFDGTSAEIMDQNLAKALEDAQKKAESTEQLLQENRIDLATAQTRNFEIAAARGKTISEQEHTTLKIENWLVDFNEKFQGHFTLSDLKNQLNFTTEWIEKERKLLQEISDEANKSVSILAERTQTLNTHIEKKPSERTLDEVKLLFEKVKFDYENASQTKASLGFQLKEDQLNKVKIGDLLKKIAAQAKISDDWAKLNESIGSADGKKFRQIAQEYTLDVLLQFANIHLQDLTNRYKMQRIPNTLGLQVVDLDMGDEIRTVYSLSGGESFLVSLALALGLASLSSSKMKVESLFIDEGFGSLDPNTLNIAMDALERLHNQGRKVGVISHVQEMTERIPVQIKVSKKSSGRSLVEVLGM